MKQLFKNIGLIAGIISVLVLNACKDNISPAPDELDFDRLFAPLNLSAQIKNQTTVLLDWQLTEGAESYSLEISYDSLEFTNIIHTVTVTETDMPYSYDLPAGDARFSARVSAINTDASLADSKWSVLTFKSLPENLFEGYDIVMDGIGAITVNWKPGKAVSSLLFVSDAGQTSFDVTAAEMVDGVKSVTGLDNAVYEVRLINNSDIRGRQNYTMEGDVLLASGADLAAAIAAASPGDVIVLTPGVQYGFVGDLTIDKSLKIKGMEGKELPVLYLTSGDRMFYIGSGLTPADSLVFESLYMSGFVNYDAVAASQHRGVFDMESEVCDLGALKFISCKLYDMGRQIVRLRGGSDQTIELFLIDDCIIHNLGNSSASYGVLCATETNTNVSVFKVTNSTIDSLRSHFIRYDDATACESIILENCTFNKTPFNSGRYLSDTRNAVITDGFYVTNCIFGNTTYDTDPSIYGIRVADGVALTITNSYSTSDFALSDYADMNGFLTPLGVPSSGLWKNPENGDFSFLGSGVEAGDPRWY